MDHLRHAGRPYEEQRDILFDIVRNEPIIHDALVAARKLNLPQWRIVSGVIYNTVWNVLTGRPSGHGINDIDVIYFDQSDRSWEAEDRIIRHSKAFFKNSPLPVEIRNQARVHLWFPKKFGQDYEALSNGDESIDRYASRTHAVGIRLLDDDSMDLYAPFGLEPIFAFQVIPNRVLANETAHRQKANRALKAWPELTVEPWSQRIL